MKIESVRTARFVSVALLVLAVSLARAQGNEPEGPPRDLASGDPPKAKTFEEDKLIQEDGTLPRIGKPAGAKDEIPVFSYFFWTGVVVLAIGGALWGVRRLLPGARALFPSPAINVIGRRALGGTASLLLVEVGKRILRIGVSKDGFLYMGEISDPEEVALVKGRAATERPGSATKEFQQSLAESMKEGEEAPKPPPPTAEEKEDDIRSELDQIRRTMDGWRA